MGATNHHHKWQVAIKTKGETANTVIQDIGWQTGRTGNVTPVLRVKPTKVSGNHLEHYRTSCRHGPR